MLDDIKQHLLRNLKTLEAVSKGPWTKDRSRDSFISVQSPDDKVGEVATLDLSNAFQAEVDSDFIIQARADLPNASQALLRIIEGCEKVIAEDDGMYSSARARACLAQDILDTINEEMGDG